MPTAYLERILQQGLGQDRMLPGLKNSAIPVFLRQPCGYGAVSHGLGKNARTEWHTKGERPGERGAACGT